MPHIIRAHFKPTPADYVNATLAFFFAQRSVILLTATSILFVVLAVPVSLIYQSQGSGIAIFILAIALAYLLIAVATVAAPLIRIRQTAAQDERMLAETQWSVSADQIHVCNRFDETELRWEMFRRIIRTRNYVLLVFTDNPRQFTFLPRRSFLTSQDDQAFLQMARVKLK